MAEEHRDLHVYIERLSAVEKGFEWLSDRVWRGTGNHHERIHRLEDANGDRVHEIELLEAAVETIKRVLGLNGYGSKNALSDIRDLVETIGKIKGGIISNSEFQGLLRKVERLEEKDVLKPDADIVNRIKALETRDSSEIGNRNLVKSAAINTVVTALILWILKALGVV